MRASEPSQDDRTTGGDTLAINLDADGDADVLEGNPLPSPSLIEVGTVVIDRPQMDGHGQVPPGDGVGIGNDRGSIDGDREEVEVSPSRPWQGRWLGHDAHRLVVGRGQRVGDGRLLERTCSGSVQRLDRRLRAGGGLRPRRLHPGSGSRISREFLRDPVGCLDIPDDPEDLNDPAQCCQHLGAIKPSAVSEPVAHDLDVMNPAVQALFGAEDRLAAPVLPGQDEELSGEIVEVDVPRHAVPQRRGQPAPVRILVCQAPTDVGSEAFREDLKDDVEDRLPIIGHGMVLALGNGCA